MKVMSSENIRLICRIMVLLMPLSDIFLGIYGYDTSIFFYIASVFCGIYCLLTFFKDPVWYIRTYILEIIFVMICLISILVNINKSDLYSFVRLIEVIIFMFTLMINAKNVSIDNIRKELRIIFNIVIGITFINGLLSIIFQLLYSMNIYAFPYMQYFRRGMFGGVYQNGNQLAIYAFISLLLSLCYVKNNKIYLVNVILELFLIAISGCRSIMLVLLVLSAFFGFRYINGLENKKLKKNLLIIGSICIVIVLGLLTFITTKKIRDYGAITGIASFMNSFTGNRLEIWKEAFTVFINNPILGVGLNNIRVTANELLGNGSLFVVRNYENTHNMIMNILCYTGIVGLISYILLFCKYVLKVKTIKKDRMVTILISLALGLMMVDMLDIIILFNNRLPVYVYCLILGYLNCIYDTEKEKM